MQITECCEWQAEDIEDGVIRNVKLLGTKSKNKRKYPATTRENALKQFEGAKVNLDHARGRNAPSIFTRFGKVVNAKNLEDGIYGDIHYLTTHEFAPAFKEAAEKMPEILGMSIRSDGQIRKEKDEDGDDVIESISVLHSVDVVADPATNSSLFESVDSSLDELTKLRNEKACRALLEEQKVEVENHLLEVLSYLPDNLREAHVKWLNRKKTKPITTRLPEPEKQKDLDYYENILRGGK